MSGLSERERAELRALVWPRERARQLPAGVVALVERIKADAVAAARAEVLGKIEASAAEGLWPEHRPVVGKFAGMTAAVGCVCMDRVFGPGENYAAHIAFALVADLGGAS